MKKLIWLILFFLASFVLGAVAHEDDIYRCLKKYGHSGKAGWIHHFEAPNMKE
jgi:hypothetical protein